MVDGRQAGLLDGDECAVLAYAVGRLLRGVYADHGERGLVHLSSPGHGDTACHTALTRWTFFQRSLSMGWKPQTSRFGNSTMMNRRPPVIWSVGHESHTVAALETGRLAHLRTRHAVTEHWFPDPDVFFLGRSPARLAPCELLQGIRYHRPRAAQASVRPRGPGSRASIWTWLCLCDAAAPRNNPGHRRGRACGTGPGSEDHVAQ